MEVKSMAAFLERLGSTPVRLMRVEALLLFSSFVWLLLELLGSHRRRRSHGFFRHLVWAVHTLSAVLPPYTVGLLQATPFRDQTFVLWGTVLLLVQVSVHSLSVYRVHDVGERRRVLVRHLMQIFLVLWLIVNYDGANRSYSATIWTFWAAAAVKVFIASRFLGKAGDMGGLLEHSKVVADYMIDEHELSSARSLTGAHDPTTMAGYRYIFHGEEELASMLPTATEYRVRLTEKMISGSKNLTTIDAVWRRIELEEHDDDDDGGGDGDRARGSIKDIALSFTLFKLLKRRFCGYTHGEAGLPKTLDFVLRGLLSGDDGRSYVRAFRVVETELAFMYDFFFTKFDTEFGFIGSFSLVVVLVATFYNIISGPFSHGYHRSNLRQKVNDADMIRWVSVLLLAALIIGSFVDVAIFPHRWLVVRKLHRETIAGKGSGEMEMSSLDPKEGSWERKLGQYQLLLSFDYHPWNVLSHLTLNLVAAEREGQKAGEKMELPEQVVVAVLSRFKESSGWLEDGRSAMAKHGMGGRLSWACGDRLPTHIHTVLVWHIATTMCASVPEKKALAGGDHRLVATSLSDYCAYLVALVPDMLPGHAYDTQRVFDAVVMEAREHLGGCPTLSSRCEQLMFLRGNGGTILELGGRLGRELRKEARRWEILADFWAEFILFLAPSTNTDIHAEKLAGGGEFMTHLWALLTHAGILDRPPRSSPEIGVDADGQNHTGASTHDSAA